MKVCANGKLTWKRADDNFLLLLTIIGAGEWNRCSGEGRRYRTLRRWSAANACQPTKPSDSDYVREYNANFMYVYNEINSFNSNSGFHLLLLSYLLPGQNCILQKMYYHIIIGIKTSKCLLLALLYASLETLTK